jgi:uncharacterized protein (TIGR03435 family)
MLWPMRVPSLAFLLALSTFTAFGQAPSAPPAIEVASVRPNQHPVGPDYNNQITYSATGFTARNATLKRLIAEAWRLQLSQVIGPGWLSKNEYDIEARVPEGAHNDQIALMLKSLLTDRFGLKMHSESRTMRAYALIAAQGGPRIHPVTSGTAAIARPGAHFRGDMRQFADFLAVQFSIPASSDPRVPSIGLGPQIPVLNETGMEGTYDFSVDIKPELNTDGFTAWSRVLEDQLGLRVENRKGSVEVLFVDDAAKIPTEN